MINIPPHLQLDFDSLTEVQRQKFMDMVMWGAAGSPGNLIITDMAFATALRFIKQMGEDPVTPIEPDRSVNHDWEFDPKKKGE